MPYRIKYKYLGMNGNPAERMITVKTRAEAIEFAYTNEKANPLLYQREKRQWVEFHKTTYCRRCGRRLTNPESVMNGIGPECIKHTSVSLSHLARFQKQIDDYLSFLQQ